MDQFDSVVIASTDHDSTKEIQDQLRAKNGQDFPLRVHPKGFLVKKINGKQYRFGKINDPEAALKKFFAQRQAIELGLDPESEYVSVDLNRLTIDGLCQLFINENNSS